MTHICERGNVYKATNVIVCLIIPTVVFPELIFAHSTMLFSRSLISCQILYHLRGVRGQKYEMQENCVFNNCKCPAPCSSVMKAAPVGITWHGDGVI